MFNLRHQLHKSTFLVCKNEGNKAVSDPESVLAPPTGSQCRRWSRLFKWWRPGASAAASGSPSGSATRAPSHRRWCWTPCVPTSSLTRRYWWPLHTACMAFKVVVGSLCRTHTTQASYNRALEVVVGFTLHTLSASEGSHMTRCFTGRNPR